MVLDCPMLDGDKCDYDFNMATQNMLGMAHITFELHVLKQGNVPDTFD